MQIQHFKKGTRVIRILHGAGVVSKEESVVLKSNKGKVWLDNGPGNDPSGPFINGRMDGVFGFWEEIVATGDEDAQEQPGDANGRNTVGED